MILAVLYLICVIVHVITYSAQGETGQMAIAVSNVFCLLLGVALAIVVIV